MKQKGTRMSNLKKTVPHPIQPLSQDETGQFRFQPNRIVQYLLDNGRIDMNFLATLDFSDNDREQFAQLIGYSLNGFSELSYVSDETYATAARMTAAKTPTEDQARILALQTMLEQAREGVKAAAVALFRIHSDDLHT